MRGITETSKTVEQILQLQRAMTRNSMHDPQQTRIDTSKYPPNIQFCTFFCVDLYPLPIIQKGHLLVTHHDITRV